jgi:hypothetical protein
MGDQTGGQVGGQVSDECPSSARCKDGVRQSCANGEWTDAPCDESQMCSNEGECIDSEEGCGEAGRVRCSDGDTIAECLENGMWEETQCQGGCQENDQGAACQDVTCIARDRICQDLDTVVECNVAGTEYRVVERCQGVSTGRECDRGECVPLCILNEKVKTNIGCDYWAADLDNAFVGSDGNFLDAAAAPFAVVVSNSHPEFTGEVTVANNEEEVASVILPPLGLHVFNLPRRDVDGTIKAPLAY